MDTKTLIERVVHGEDPKELIEAEKWGKVFKGDKVRIRWDNSSFRDTAMIEELPGKPVKRRVRVANFNPDWLVNVAHLNEFILGNLLRDVKMSKGMSYDQAVSQFKKAADKAKKAVIAKGVTSKFNNNEIIDEAWFKSVRFDHLVSEDTVSYLEVEPDDYQPMNLKGKDFALNSTWSDFSVYSPDYDPQDMDPSYTMYSSKSKGAARKLFKMGKSNPSLFKGITWGKLTDFFNKNKIGFNTNFSVWR